jgi:galactokinase/mevalonate kinase-like predicted kinase
MPYRLTIPARINILGNPSDAVEGDFATISAAVSIHAHAEIHKNDEIVLEQRNRTEEGFETVARQTFSPDEIPLPYDGELDLCKGAINRLYRYSPEFQEKVKARGIQIATWTEVPRQSGLGGSSLFVLLTLAGLRLHYQLDPLEHNDYILGELTQRVEAKELNITCGYADRYVPLFGGLAYIDYRGKLYQKTLHDEPYSTYERLDPWIDGLPLVAISSGVKRDSGDVHGRMRPLYIEEHDAWLANGGDTPPMVAWMQTAWESAWRGKIALLRQDWETFGKLMNDNHRAVDEMMTYAGFTNGAGEVNNLLIRTALDNGAFGAKLTGAGGGGSVFAITQPGQEKALMDIWRQTAEDAGLERATVYHPQISKQGLRIEILD